MPTQEREAMVPLTCPSCGGVLKANLLASTYACQQSHTWTSLELDNAMRQQVKHNLLNALRLITEREALLTKMAALSFVSSPTDVVHQRLFIERVLASFQQIDNP